MVPGICICAVFKRVLQERGLAAAQMAIGDLHAGRVIDLDSSLTLSAAKISVELKLPMADSMILAPSLAHGATLWTRNEHFTGVEGLEFVDKQDKGFS
jgi:predicted nucleic acid-binding protein